MMWGAPAIQLSNSVDATVVLPLYLYLYGFCICPCHLQGNQASSSSSPRVYAHYHTPIFFKKNSRDIAVIYNN